jgi:hypothetical protein
MMKKYAASFGLVTLAATIACNGDGSAPRVTNPTPLATVGASTNVSIRPSIITAQAVNQPSCPLVPPFVGSLGVDIQAVDFPLSLSRVQMTFIDSAGLSAPTVTLPAPVLTRQFGSTLVEARSSRTFPFTFPFGCNTRRTGQLVVVIVINDRDGQDTKEIRVPVR